jgi:glutamate---cysteine ligase / carboxylate-amine ligase
LPLEALTHFKTGLIVHVGVPSGEQALAVMRAMNPYLPLLLALSANSPFWHGTDTGMLSSRLNIMESFPFAGLPQHISSWKEFEHYYSALQASSGIVQSLKDLYWHIRPNLSYGTVEVRICDIMPTITETMAVVALIHCLVVSICENSQNNPKRLQLPPELDWIAPGNLWIAARDGLDGIIATDLNGTRQKISDILIELVEQLLPTAKKLHCEEELQDVLRIITNGNGAQRQLKTYFETKSLKQVVAVAMQEFTDSFATVV